MHPKVLFFEGRKGDIEVEVALQYNDGYQESVFSFANNINTREGGTHLTGFRAALTGQLSTYAEKNGYLKNFKGGVTGDDVREGLCAVVSVRMPDPQFEGQTKAKLGNSGKARYDKVLSHNEIRLLISAMGTGIGTDEFDLTKLRYHKIILMTDADVDGAHIRTLLLTFFFRHMNAVIEAGNLFIAQPPLFKVKKGKVEKYLMNDREFEDFFLTSWVATAKLKVPGTKAPIVGEALMDLLRAVGEYRGLFGKFVRRGVPAAILAELLRQKFRGNKRGVGHAEIGEAVKVAAAAVNGHDVEVRPGDNDDPHTVVIAGSPPLTFSTELFRSQDYTTLLAQWGTVAAAAKGPTVVLDENDAETPVKSVEELWRVVLDKSRAGASFQRYKGLDRKSVV